MIIRTMLSIFCIIICSLTQASSVWKVSYQSNTFYLAGTVHVLAEQDYPLPSAFEQAYQAADIAVFESDLLSMAKPSAQQRIMNDLRYKTGAHLYQNLSSETQLALDSYLNQRRLDKALIASFKPGMVASFLSLTELQHLGIDAKGVDAYFTERAKAERKPRLALETVDQQIAFLANLAQGNEDKFISYTLADIASMQSLMSQLKLAWAKGDTQFLDHHFVQPLAAQFPDIYQHLLVDRNKQWLTSLEGFARTDRVEVVFVGAAHLVGEDGLVALLLQRGYDLSPL